MGWGGRRKGGGRERKKGKKEGRMGKKGDGRADQIQPHTTCLHYGVSCVPCGCSSLTTLAMTTAGTNVKGRLAPPSAAIDGLRHAKYIGPLLSIRHVHTQPGLVHINPLVQCDCPEGSIVWFPLFRSLSPSLISQLLFFLHCAVAHGSLGPRSIAPLRSTQAGPPCRLSVSPPLTVQQKPGSEAELSSPTAM